LFNVHEAYSGSMTADRHTINRAFWALGLRFQWDERDWAMLSGMPDLITQMRYWLPRHQPHLVAVYGADALGRMVEEIIAAPDRHHFGMEAHGHS